MHSKKTVLIVDLMNAANMELIRLDFRSSALSRHDKEFRRFCNYCTENGIQAYDAETGPRYFRSRFGLNIGDANIKLNRQQLDARNSIRFLDDIFQFGYALRYSHHDYTLPQKYANLLNEYLAWCQRNNNSAGTIDVKRTKIRQFLICFGMGAAIGVPTYLLTRQAIGNTGALFAMLAIMLPAFLLAMYEKDGLPFEKVIRNIIRVKFTRPGIRPYRTENIYAPFARKEEPIEQSKKAKKRK